MGSDRELNALASLELGLDEGPNGEQGEDHEDGEDETVEEVKAGVSQLSADGFDAHIGDLSLVKGSEPGATGLAPLVGRANDGVLKRILSHCSGEPRSMISELTSRR